MNNTPQWLSPEEYAAWREFIRMQEKLVGRLSRLMQAESSLSAADFVVLVELTEAPEGRLRFMDLVKAVEWEKSRMSHQITRMTKRGLVVREECADDGRGAFIVITPAGREAIAAAAPRHVEAVRRLFIEALTPEELDSVAHVSRRVLERLEEMPC
ncbi:MarR family winged helix-turn-helix transcriptional regulator [Streptomyces chiangmaiensis]|uniref:MarR family transcriptional regulator n=1 Tax=Streptomyces chiangmaiensis TaxID=766497 RepID=A0ABU7FR53_9ACTN|nr:MarR family transcriptional regulator [Streptomyces chiangmaiensis]MED7826405.1 MarR family transcriptional regulator [Streptomyces chiangmaiensis]